MGGHYDAAVVREVVKVRTTHATVHVVGGDELHAPLGIPEGTSGGVRDVSGLASILAPVKDDLLLSRDLDFFSFPHLTEDYQGGNDGGNRQQPPPQNSSPDDKGSPWIELRSLPQRLILRVPG